MKTLICIAFLSPLSTILFAQPPSLDPETQDIRTLILSLAEAGDKQDAGAMAALLHADFRVVFNRPFGNAGTSILDKDSYLGMISEKKIGGDTRKVEFKSIEVMDHIAAVNIVMKGAKAEFNSFLGLIKDESDHWQVITDMPHVKFQ